MSNQRKIAETEPAGAGVAPAIAVSGVGYRYPRADRIALSDIAFTVPPGASFGLLGPNGAGKSTLLSLLTGVLAPQKGEIVIGGHSARRGLAPVRAMGSLVPQDFAFYPGLTGRENLDYFAGLHRLDRRTYAARLEKAVAATQLSDWLGRPAETYSGGLKRRLNFAIGLLNAPRILYLDEPTVGIDARSRQCILDAIQALRSEGVTLVYTSHYMEEVEALCDEIAVIDRGRLVASGRTADLLSAAAARRLSVSLAGPAGAAAREALAALKIDWLADNRLEVTLSAAEDLPATLSALSAAGLSVVRAEFGVSRLERLYLSLLDGGDGEEAAA
ncbi:MAG: ABC transporter ATP-binding protein [Caulobacter sp.]